MITERDLRIVQELRKNARKSLTDVSKDVSIPSSSLFKMVKRLENGKVIQKYSTLIDYNKLGYHTRVCLNVRVKEKEKFKEFMMRNPRVNSLLRISGNSFFAELIFKNMLELEDFLENLEKFSIQNKEVFHIIQEIKKEERSLVEEDDI